MSKNHRLISEIINGEKRVSTRPIASRIDYQFFNYCATCALKYSKEILRCKECNQKVRTRPWHRSKIRNWKRI